ncbi:P-loop containing nucleoside triphosphate hydrolase protein [Mycena floridula]|nr:P-loop containing nucleoside triphosphate hydrolase protein [Mycena floridula]
MVSSVWLRTSRACSWQLYLSSLGRNGKFSLFFWSTRKLTYFSLFSGKGVYQRRAQSNAALAHAVEDSELDPAAPTMPMDTPSFSAASGRHFKTLEGKVSKATLDAIMIKPFRLTNMSEVQEEPYEAEKHRAPGAASRDLLVRAKTGTGKTLAFLVPAIESRIKAIAAAGEKAVKDAGLVTDNTLRHKAERRFAQDAVGTLILSPTRELATQIANEALRLSHFHTGFEVRLFTGGTSKPKQLRDWMKGRRDIVVATTGRLRDVMTSEPEVAKGLMQTQMLVLDEADTLMDMGFRDDIEAIIANSVLHNHKLIDVIKTEDSPVHAHIPQFSTVLPSAAHQLPYVMKLIAHAQMNSPAASKVIVFLPTTKMTQLYATLVRNLMDQLLPAGRQTKVYEIHSKRTQESRTNVSEKFRGDRNSHSVLITSDVSARGVDYPGVTRVIQVGIPSSKEQYIHRVGRTGRAGLSGRGDLVLLPWEIVTVVELDQQLETLMREFDQNPDKPYQHLVGQFDRRGVPAGQNSRLKAPVTEILEKYEPAVGSLLKALDPEAVRETFMAILGYYISKSAELRVSREVVFQGCRQWAMEAGGLSEPPYVSPAFLQKLGYDDNRSKRFGQPREYSRAQRSTPWAGRGRQSTRDLPTGNSRVTFEMDENDYKDDPLQYKTPRYNDQRRPWVDRGGSGGFRDSRSSGFGSSGSRGGSSGSSGSNFGFRDSESSGFGDSRQSRGGSSGSRSSYAARDSRY